MSKVQAFAKFLDQPRLVSTFSQTLPVVLVLGAGSIVAKETYNAPRGQKEKKLIQSGTTIFGAITSSLYAPKITAKIFKTAPQIVNLKQLNKNNTKLVNNFLQQNKVSSQTNEILQKAKTNILNVKEVEFLSKNLKTRAEKNLFNKLIPEPENITSKEIFSEIGRLSVFGLIPVLGGIAGGILGDRLTEDNYQKKIPDKIKEGVYQYLANIFLCNIGAGMALGILEKLSVKSKITRAIGMVSGIIITGVVGGSTIANLIGEKFINKYFNEKEKVKRKPEALDICLHTDDIATVAVMSGLKWIEPALPILYSISGYRAGSGYRG